MSPEREERIAWTSWWLFIVGYIACAYWGCHTQRPAPRHPAPPPGYGHKVV